MATLEGTSPISSGQKTSGQKASGQNASGPAAPLDLEHAGSGGDLSASDITETDRGETDLTVIHEAAKLIGHSATPEIAITSLLRLMSQMLGLNRGRVLLPSITGDALRLYHSYGLTEQERARAVYAMGEGITGSVMKSGRAIVVPDIDQEPRFLFRAVERDTLPPETVAFIAVPIMDGDTPMGVLGAHRIRLRPRSIDADLIVLRILATLIAQVLKINTLIEARTSRLAEENKELKDALDQKQKGHGLLGESPALRHALHQALSVADTDVTVLLAGESGTGKEHFAQILHLNSERRDQPFVAINCAAIPENLLESELFGHERGAFTGASQRKIGKFELASGGTLFLDEIGDLTLELQAKLLRVLEGRLIQRVGGLKDIPVDVRVVAATHKNLQQAVNEGRFRMDLFYRLNVFPLHLPALRERDGDTRLLVRHFLLMANRDYGRNSFMTDAVMHRLEQYSWPGNIRQLENVVKRAVLVADEGEINVSHIDTILRQEASITDVLAAENKDLSQGGVTFGLSPQPRPLPGPLLAPQATTARPYSWVTEDERETLVQALTDNRGNKTRAAASLGMTMRQFRYRLAKLGVS